MVVQTDALGVLFGSVPVEMMEEEEEEEEEEDHLMPVWLSSCQFLLHFELLLWVGPETGICFSAVWCFLGRGQWTQPPPPPKKTFY